VATTAVQRDFIRLIADEIASGVEAAVDRWMIQIDLVLTDMQLTNQDRLNAVREIVESYKQLTGRELDCPGA
jgi:CheY-like chemotaxis protein